jgi:hypothetical protein
LSNQEKTFGLARPRDYLGKLNWDLQRLMEMQRKDDPALRYQAMNCALTAWHMHEWVYPFLPERLLSELPKLASFRDLVKERSVYMNCCREIADAGKHHVITSRHHPDIQTRMVEITVDGVKSEWWYIDAPGIGPTDPAEVIGQAHAFWVRFLIEAGIYHQ